MYWGGFVKKESFWLRIGFITIALLAMICTIHLINRTGIIVFFVCLSLSFLISSRFKMSNMIVSLLLLLILGIIIIRIGLIDQNILDAYAIREERKGAELYTIGGRYNMWMSAFGDMFRYPFGWTPVYYKYAHNLWLDIARVAGLLAFIPFLIATILHCKNLLRLICDKYISNFSIIIISINLAMFLASFVEPVIEGSLSSFCLLMMMWGITKSLVVENRALMHRL